MDNSQKSAYPYVLPYHEADCSKGLTKLESFTMAAMQGLCHSAGINLIQHEELTQSQVNGIADAAIWIAGATLLELSKQEDGGSKCGPENKGNKINK
jgi:hypothetical protein